MKKISWLIWALASIHAVKPFYYTLILTSKDGKIPHRLVDYLESKFPQTKLETKDRLGFYKTSPDLPLAACDEAEYYLLGPGNELLRKGCISAADLATPTWQIGEALAARRRF